MAITYDEAKAWDGALARLAKKSVEVIKGGATHDGTILWLVSSRTTEGKWYTITQEGGHLSCTCEAATHGNYCCHRAAVRLALLRERAAEDAEDARQEAEAPDRWALTERGRHYLAKVRAQKAAVAAATPSGETVQPHPRAGICDDCGQPAEYLHNVGTVEESFWQCDDCEDRAQDSIPEDVRHLVAAPAHLTALLGRDSRGFSMWK